MSISAEIKSINAELPATARLIAISKTHPAEYISEAYAAGQRDFGENKVQELRDKQPALPADIRWHFIGHLQTNKVKYIAPYIHLIHTADSLRLLEVISREGVKNRRVIDVLLEIRVATDDPNKTGLPPDEARRLLDQHKEGDLPGVRIRGLMAMASNCDDETRVEADFAQVETLFKEFKEKHFADKDYFCELSMGMSGDYRLALRHGATMVRIGSRIFGARDYGANG